MINNDEAWGSHVDKHFAKSPSNAELREAILDCFGLEVYYHKDEDLAEYIYMLGQGDQEVEYTIHAGQVDYMLENLEKLFQTREQQLLTKLLGELPKDFDLQWCMVTKSYSSYCNNCDYCKHRMSQDYSDGYNKAVDQVVSVIERLQNKTNDGGRNGGL